MDNLCQCPFLYCNDIASLKFINREKISCICLRNHITTKDLNEIKQLSQNKISEKNKNCICNEHNSEYIYFCKICQINFCNFCKDKHNNHKYISIIEKIPSNNITKSLEKYIDSQKNEILKIKTLFNELVKYLKNQFDLMFNSLYNFLLFEESILVFSLKNINHINSIENIKYIFDINFPQPQNKNSINYNLSQIKFNYQELKDNINNKPMFTQIENIYKYIGDIYISSQKEMTKEDLNEINNSFMIMYKKPFIENDKSLQNINEYENEQIKKDIKKMKFDMKQYKILNEHEEEIRNIISLNNGFFASSSIDSNLKIFNCLTGECILYMKEPYEDKICYILRINTDKNTEETNILLLSRHLIFIRFNNNYYYNHNEFDDSNPIEVIQSIDNNDIYISQGIQLSNSDIVTYDDNNEIKIYKINPITKTYLLIHYNINFKDIEFCSFLEVKPNILVASSNKKLDKGENIIKFFNTNDKDIYINDNKNIIIKNLNCSTGRDSMVMIQKNKILAVGLQTFEKDKKDRKNNVNGIALIDIDIFQIIQIIEEYRVHSICTINLYINYKMMNNTDIFKRENLYVKKKLLVTAGYDKETETRLIKFFEIAKNENNSKNKNIFIEIIKENEIINEHEGFINSIKWLENGFLVTGSSDKMIFLYTFINPNNNDS